MLSFSQWFFSGVFGGTNVRDAFNWARSAMRAVSFEGQNPQISDAGLLARSTYLGAAFVTGADAPTIGDYARDVILTGPSATLWASGVQSSEGIAEVFSYVVKPGASPTNDLSEKVVLAYNASTARWQATYGSFDPDSPNSVVYFAKDLSGQLSMPYPTIFAPPDESDFYDRFYDDNTTATWNFISMSSSGAIQQHNFWKPGDEDWLVFNMDAGTTRSYSVNVTDVATSCNPSIAVYLASNMESAFRYRDDDGPGYEELLSWFAGPSSGTVLVRIAPSPNNPGLWGRGTSYTLTVSGDWGDRAGLATIAGPNWRPIGQDGGRIGVFAAPTYGEPYTASGLEIPEGALSETSDFVLGDIGDIGFYPWFDATASWSAIFPSNASALRIMADEGRDVAFKKPSTLQMQFVDDGPTVVFDDGTTVREFTIDDVPPGVNPQDMRIYTYDKGSGWRILPGTQTVAGDVVSMPISSLGSGVFAVAPGVTPTPTDTPTITPTFSNTPSATPTFTPTLTPTNTASPTPTFTPTPTNIIVPPTETWTPTPTNSPPPSATDTPTPTASIMPTDTPTPTPTATPSTPITYPPNTGVGRDWTLYE